MPTFEDFIVNLQSKDSHHEKRSFFNRTINYHPCRLQTKHQPDEIMSEQFPTRHY